MTELTFIVPGIPQARQAHFIGRGNGGQPIKILPKESAVYQERVMAYGQLAMQSHNLHQPITEPVHLWVRFVFPAPMSALKKAERQKIEAGELLVWPRIRQDIDNSMKCVFDGLKYVVIFDDHLIVSVEAQKKIGLEPRTEITIRTLT